MKNYQCILFDLDGTLANTYQGILHSYEYAAEKMSLEKPSEKVVNEVIGAPLVDVFKYKFNLNEGDTQKAVSYYRDYYAQKGVLEAEAYPKMKKVIKTLKEREYRVGVTTLKNEQFAINILKKMDLYHYFDIVIGMDGKDKLTKSDMLRRAMLMLNQEKDKTVLVGDSSYDAVGAKEAGIDFIAVTYGFGFKKIQDVQNYIHVHIIGVPEELLDIL